MPNHCHNRVTFYPSGNNTDSSLDQIETIKDIFTGESVFPQIIPEPDWLNTPLMSSQHKFLGRERGEVGELPQYVEDPWKRLVFKSTGNPDDRWYDWRVQNWDTKWDAYDVEVTDDDPEQFEVEFNTAWSPPEAICHKLREDYPDIAISWFYDEPGCEMAGVLVMRDDIPDYHKVDPYKYVPTKPLYMLIKVEVDKEIVYNQCQAGKYAVNHCNKLEYELADWYYPDDEQYPYIAK